MRSPQGGSGAEHKIKGSYQSGQMGQTVNLLAYAFGGSNPSLPTKKVPVGVARFPVVPACGHRGWRGLTLIRYIFAEVAQLIEHQPSKLRVASLSLVFRSNAQQRVIRTPPFSDDGEFVSLACSAK